MALTNKDALRVIKAYIEKWCELTAESIQSDVDAIESLDLFEQTYMRSYWIQRVDKLNVAYFPKAEDDSGKLTSVYAIYGKELQLPSSHIKADVERRLKRLKQEVANQFEDKILRIIDHREVTSPIEQIFLMEWHAAGVNKLLDVQIISQKELATKRGPYRIDFVIKSKQSSEEFDLAIELDGHEFHEKTKEQVTQDKRRERAIVAIGRPVLRFSGSEIVRDCRACINEVVELLRERFK